MQKGFCKGSNFKQMEKRKHHESTIERVRLIRAITAQL